MCGGECAVSHVSHGLDWGSGISGKERRVVCKRMSRVREIRVCERGMREVREREG